MSTTVGIIAEYNPFHNGHKLQIEKAKKSFDNIIVIMSSSFTQRGTPSILNKFSRSKIAIENGANLVIELPTIYSNSNSEIFSKGAIYILNSLGVIDSLMFGSEDSLEILIDVSNKLIENKMYLDENIKHNLALGYSYPKAMELSADFLNCQEKIALKKPNNILGIEYLKALKFFNSNIKPVSIIRTIHHNSDNATMNLASASYVRKLLFDKNFNETKNYIPTNTFENIINNELNTPQNYFDIFKYSILKDDIDYSNYFDYEDGLNNRFIKYLNIDDIYEFVDKITTKRYTKSRIFRLIFNLILDIKINLIKESFSMPYIRPLAMDDKGKLLLKKIKENNMVITKFASIKKLNNSNVIKKVATKEVFATNIYNMMVNRPINEDFLISPFMN